MLKALFRWAVALALVGAAVFWWVTRPQTLPADALAGLEPDMARGEAVFYAAGCASCHAAPGAEGEAKLVLAGGRSFPSPFGTFLAPNISPDPAHGIGGWSAMDLANAMLKGVSPDGAHYFPAFPYGSYAKAELGDVVSLHAYLMTLPSSAEPSKPHEVGLPFNIRRSLGGWKFLFLNQDWVVADGLTEAETQGRYLVEALGHCGECHTARNPLGGMTLSAWLGGAPNPSGRGTIPNITPGKLSWSERDIAEYLKSGFTPDFDSAGGHMADVIENTAKLTDADRAAIAAYLKKVAPIE
ncbi:putative diheme cytochrome c-553 [Candidatus Rhodobacter oscarellae]|uniref:Putative diheme cytochrome c-553 n=1 Tax=Candidatus Rhodobacter oscarellae TaxID=1675527 RepID=A0A0J9GUW6_9RHOB|nr:cytochrome c [Candidatus Rhodobacter lobularis]KMW57373.1 putative diheme cytochrome c-553 [Candidatus Rhodobacter lobularis]